MACHEPASAAEGPKLPRQLNVLLKQELDFRGLEGAAGDGVSEEGEDDEEFAGGLDPLKQKYGHAIIALVPQ